MEEVSCLFHPRGQLRFCKNDVGGCIGSVFNQTAAYKFRKQ